MSRAELRYDLYNEPNDDVNNRNLEATSIVLESGSLRYIDSITSSAKDEMDFLKREENRGRIMNFLKKHNTLAGGRLKVINVRDISSKEILPVLYDDPDPINATEEMGTQQVSEVERARKLMFNSKEKIFLNLVLHSSRLAPTLNYRIRITDDEKKILAKCHIPVFCENYNYYVNFRDVLKFGITNKLGSLRALTEDTLEAWKNNLLALSSEDIYYYSRHLRLLRNRYDILKNRKRGITNLRINPPLSVSVSKGYHIRKNTQRLTVKEHFRKKYLQKTMEAAA